MKFLRNSRTVYILSKNGSIIETNEALVPLTGYSVKDLVGSRFYKHFDINSGQELKELIMAPRPLYFFAQEAWLKTRDGIDLPVWLQIITMFNSSNEPVGFVVHADQVPHYEGAGEEKTTGFDSFRDLFGLMSDAILEIESDLIVSYFNQAGLDLFAFSEDEIGGKLKMTQLLESNCFDLLVTCIYRAVHGVQQPPVPAKFRRMNGTGFEGELCIRRLDNKNEPGKFLAVVKGQSGVSEEAFSSNLHVNQYRRRRRKK